MITRQLKLKILIQGLVCRKNFCLFYHGHHLLDEIPKPTLSSVHNVMLNLIHQNRQDEAITVFKKQSRKGLSTIDEVCITVAIKACRGDTKLASQIHGFATASDYMSYVCVCNSLINMYCKSREFSKAFSIFDNLANPDTVSYNTIISGFQDSRDALTFAYDMHSAAIVFDAITYTSVLAHCADCYELGFGIQLHCLVFKLGLNSELFVGNALVTLYSKCEKLVEAEKVFFEMPQKDLVSWNSILSGYAQEGSHGSEAIIAFRQMVRGGIRLDHVSFTSVITACGQKGNLDFGKQVHTLSMKRGYETHVSVCNVLMSLYSKCAIVEDARLVFENTAFRNVVSWTTMLTINEADAMNIFREMRRHEIYPNDVTFVGLIHAITTNCVVQDGQVVHGLCIKSNFLSEVNVANCFITMYGKFKFLEDCIMVFEELNYRDIISWNALLSGYSLNGMYQEALQVFLLVSLESRPNPYTFGSVLHAIASSESLPLRQGQLCHCFIRKLGLNTHPVVSGALLDMYAKRGNICESQKIFSELTEKSQVSWTAIISAYCRHGEYESVMNHFNEMIMEDVKPDSITFLSVLTACGRNGMVDAGVEIFSSMIIDHSIEPTPEHYSCIVDMLGRAGRLDAAEKFMNQIPGGPGLSVLQSLLGSCRIYGNVEMATRVSDALIAMEPSESGSYVLMSNLFAEKGKWEKVAKLRAMMRNRRVTKEIGFSWADVDYVNDSAYLHGFSSGDKSHSMSKEIYWMAEFLGSEMKRRREYHATFDNKRLEFSEVVISSS
ncbi:pentatricopeptide repeat-containing protein mitochondrial-like [Dorcoceras hygrometricum]|uniref:Pentatricopeptide repeat-containing protein mitochondrial-like n=1 Tax=Dorcoceras hygrometricum TaxID=472368 RepID=A0A2Z7CPQ7_9LAMI|nr:pentatricopeptide repeat-containing protein mitochondrial-like [Dorcoceras hygrometricum]